MSRIEIYKKAKQLGIKHYINSASVFDGKHFGWVTNEGFAKCHYTDESFEEEIKRLESHGYNFFDVIHIH